MQFLKASQNACHTQNNKIGKVAIPKWIETFWWSFEWCFCHQTQNTVRLTILRRWYFITWKKNMVDCAWIPYANQIDTRRLLSSISNLLFFLEIRETKSSSSLSSKHLWKMAKEQCLPSKLKAKLNLSGVIRKISVCDIRGK